MSDLLQSLSSLLDREYAKDPEIVHGCDVHEAAKLVDLSVAYTPVIEHRQHTHPGGYPSGIPTPVRVVKDGGRYCLMFKGDFKWVDEASMRVMRARYLLWRGWFYTNLGLLPNGEQQQAISAFFPGGTWRPDADSELGKLLGLK